MAVFCKTLFSLFWSIILVTTEIVEHENSSIEINHECSSRGDDIKITIYSRKNKTGQLFAQVKLEEGSRKMSSWQVDIDHDSSCGSSTGERDGNIREKALDGIGNAETPIPFYELIHGLGYYKFHHRAKTWDEAKLTCQNEGAHLAIINSQVEAQLLMDLYDRLIRLPSKHNFVGGNDIDKDGTWLTIFNETLNGAGFVEWNAGEPDRRNGENCLGINSEKGKLVALECSTNYGFYCELEL